MKTRGFTLIELLAVIVILAIIALIAVPMVLNIIENAKESANKKSIDMYGHAIDIAISNYQIEEGKDPKTISDLTIEYNGKVECTTEKINKDGTVYLSGCKVSGKDVEYTYGEDKSSTDVPTTPDEPPVTPEETTTVYRWSADFINIGGPIDPSDTTKFTTDPTTLGKTFYLKHVIDKDNKVKESYACGVYNSEEYCVRGGDPNFYGYATNESEYTGNALILKGLKDKGLGCYFGEGASGCNTVSVSLLANSNGYVDARDASGHCCILEDGRSSCVSS